MTATTPAEIARILEDDNKAITAALLRLDWLKSLATARRRLANLDSYYAAERARLEARIAEARAELALTEQGRAPA